MVFQKLQSCYQRIPHEHIKLIRSKTHGLASDVIHVAVQAQDLVSGIIPSPKHFTPHQKRSLSLLHKRLRRCQQFGKLGFEQCFIRLCTPTESDGAFDLFLRDAHGGQNVARSIAF